MESEEPTPPVPVVELQYESDKQLRAAGLTRLVAKWCIAVGVLVVAEMGFALGQIFGFRPPFNFPYGYSLMNWFGVAVRIASFCMGVWLIIWGIHVLHDRLRFARSFWIILSLLACFQMLSYAPTFAFYLPRSASLGNQWMIVRALLGAVASCFPSAILLTIVRHPAVRDAIDEAN